MYDFYFGTREDIEKDPKAWLLAIKRMLPRWINGIPDSEFLGLYDLMLKIESEGVVQGITDRVLVESGCGASTIVLLYFAIRWETELYTWDISSNKLAYLRSILTDTLLRHFSDANLFRHWKYVAFSSCSKHAGMEILSELRKSVCACFLDSEHTWATLGAEIQALCPVMANGGIVAIDDGYYRFERVNTAYVNMIRTKVGLQPAAIPDNEGPMFWKRAADLLEKHFSKVVDLEGGTYRTSFTEDIFWQYFDADRKSMAELGMEKLAELSHRFDAWQVYHK